MSLSLQQVLKQTQKLIMTPQMQQSIQLLQLNSLELEQMIHQEMMDNPFLELTDDEEELTSEKVSEEEDGGDRQEAADDSGLSEQEKEKDREREIEEEPAEKDTRESDDSPSPEEETDTSEDFEKFEQSDVDWDTEYSESDSSAYSAAHESFEEHDFTTYTALEQSLYDSLMRQLRLSALDGNEAKIGAFLIGNIDENGFLDSSLENQAKILGYHPDLIDMKGGTDSEKTLRRILYKLRHGQDKEHIKQLNRKQLVASVVAEYLEITPDEAMTMSRLDWLRGLIAKRLGRSVEEIADMRLGELILHTIAWRTKVDPQDVYDILEIIQEFEPTGVAARDLGECLRLQCEEKGIRNRLLYTVLDDHLEDLQQKKFREIARALEVPEAEVVEVFHLVSKLEPRPGRSQTKETARYITPDVYVKKIEGRYMYFLNEGDAGRLRVASAYRRMLARKAAAEGKDSSDAQYAQEKYKNAVWLIKNIEKRKSTVLRVTEAIMNYQKDFLEKGIEHLHPLTLRNIAEVVGMHESTIARVTTGKYVETPRGIFELKFFFSSGLETDSGEDASSRSIKEMITQLIQAEDTKHPLSDQKIADMLRDKGIQIARRTVAKYREQLKILPAKLRKQVP
ncbi:RNA polymerase factor sigma-54 [bacterium]|nr:RNA polymerase factor sigma-54 [bacterium]